MIDASSGNLNDFVISPSTRRRLRASNRTAISTQYIVVYWDGKVMQDNSDELKGHIAVSISGTPEYESGKLLGVEKVESSTGTNQAATVHTLLQNWNCSNNVIGYVLTPHHQILESLMEQLFC